MKGNEDSSTRVEKMKKIEAMNNYEILLAEKVKTYDVLTNQEYVLRFCRLDLEMPMTC